MTGLSHDASPESRRRAGRQRSGADRFDEVWRGVDVVGPMPNVEHQELVTNLVFIFKLAVPDAHVYPGVNVSEHDDHRTWRQNYRVPDIAVVLPGGHAKNCETHLCGGPDLVVEIVSEGDRSREKVPFYAEIGVRELLVVDRYPWMIELYRHDGQTLTEIGRSTAADPVPLTSEVTPLRFQLQPTGARPRIEIERLEAEGTDSDQRWSV